MEIYRKLLEINRNLIEINRDLMEINRDLIAIKSNLIKNKLKTIKYFFSPEKTFHYTRGGGNINAILNCAAETLHNTGYIY